MTETFEPTDDEIMKPQLAKSIHSFVSKNPVLMRATDEYQLRS